jgi:hypothetical protein
MFVVTNREIHEDQTGLEKLGDRPNSQGPNELRLVEATRSGSTWTITVLPNEITQAMKDEVGITDTGLVFASRLCLQQAAGGAQSKAQLVFLSMAITTTSRRVGSGAGVCRHLSRRSVGL